MIGSGVTLITGLPGSGKTALVVKMLTTIKDRPIFVMGIPDLKLPHFETPPVDQWVELRNDPDDPSLQLPYFTFPPNSIVVLDEAQRVYRPRPVSSKVPEIVAAFETRRHTGVDFVLLTQDATFIDSNVRKLTARHIHIHVTSFGRYKLEWQGVGEPREASSRDLAQRERYQPDKKVFDLYTSAVLHTKPVVKRPLLVYAFVPMLAAIIIGGFYVKHRINERMTTTSTATKGEITTTGNKQEKTGKSTLTANEYISQYQPRIASLPHTAPAYDQVTQVTVAPEPIGCYDSERTGCKCFTQQGTPYETTQPVCRQILAHGLWMPWKQSDKNQREKVEHQPTKNSQGYPQEQNSTVQVMPANQPISLSPPPKKT